MEELHKRVKIAAPPEEKDELSAMLGSVQTKKELPRQYDDVEKYLN